MTRARALAVAVAMLLMGGILGTASAQATNYRYWTYWSGAGQAWTFSPVGPSSAVPADGAVEGWRFAVSAGVGGQGAEPTIAPAVAFQQFCADVPAASGMKRVAVVIDYGGAGDAPAGQNPSAATGGCAQLPENNTGGQVLQQVSEIRVEGGLICAINGYPQGECAPAVSDQPSATTSPKGAAPATSPTDPTGSKDKKKERTDKQQNEKSGGADSPNATPTLSGPKQTPSGSVASTAPSPSASKGKKSSRPTASDNDKRSPSSTPDSSETGAASPNTSPPADIESNAAAVQTGQVSRSTGPSPLAVIALVLVAGLAGWFLLRYRRRSS
ncbi:MAG: hypothetical protein K0U60_00410 [Actinomycetia bacterium]|nr:hypothetical protein [Actinomycetes bacterium]MCH9801012.1 hypothetical protein [Actinomycetes bacterium]